ncbi:MAG: type II secretion system protein [Candidatus Aminicenantes bacterium]|nr:type II secretion system protein [Candidatus Aminicenantes bacterium]
MPRQNGFSLTELLVAAAILLVLAGAILPLTKIAVQREKEIELHRNLRIIREAIDAYKKMADEKKIEVDDSTEGYPPDLETLVKGVKLKSDAKNKKGEEKLMKFLRRIPTDPMTRSTEWGLLSTQDAPDASSWGEQNVFDVYTKSRRKALDGTNYRDW